MSRLDMNDLLLKDVRSRQEPDNNFNYGIMTADRFVKTLQDCVGSDLCYRYAAKGKISFQDALTKAAETLTYSDEGMVTEDVYLDFKARFKRENDVELPKNTLMVFRHVLTTDSKDRDGDILRTKGAKVDPKLLLLWQHVHTLPIGKMVTISNHTEKKLEVVSAIVDLNELAHDAAVMVDNDMGRFSHGFRALEYEKIKSKSPVGGKEKPGGFDVKGFEILEESLVSVPANADAEIQEVMLDLIESDKLTSSMMKGYGKQIRSSQTSVSSAGGLDLNINVTVKGAEDEIGRASCRERV